MAFDKPEVKAAGDYFKYAEHAGAWAILFDVKRDAQNSRNHFNEIKDAVYGDIYVFAAEGTDPKVFRNERIDAPLVQRELRDKVGIGNQTVRVLAKWGDKKMWVLRFPDSEIREAVVAWWEARESALAGEDVPDYLK